MEGIDTIATISINSIEIGKTDNAFRLGKFDITSALQNGINIIQLSFDSPVGYAKKEALKYPYPVPFDDKDIVYDVFHGELYRNFIRKPQSHFAGNWGLASLNIGIYRDIKIIGYDDALIDNVGIEIFCKN